MAIAADGHGAPATAMGAGVVVEEKTASGVGAATNGRFEPFGDKFRRGTRDGRKQPVQAFFARQELKTPHAVDQRQLVMTFSDAKNLVDRLRPYAGKRAFLAGGGKNGPKGFAETQHFQQYAVYRLRLVFRQGAQVSRTLFSGHTRSDEEGHEFSPGEVVGGGSKIREIEGQPSGDQASGLKRWGGHIEVQ